MALIQDCLIEIMNTSCGNFFYFHRSLYNSKVFGIFQVMYILYIGTTVSDDWISAGIYVFRRTAELSTGKLRFCPRSSGREKVTFVYISSYCDTDSMRDDPYWTSRRNSLELIELST